MDERFARMQSDESAWEVAEPPEDAAYFPGTRK
jgi:hypothetical protein